MLLRLIASFIALASMVLLAGCDDVRHTVVLERLADGSFKVQDVCSAGMRDVAVYRAEGSQGRVLTPADIEWGASVGSDQPAINEAQLFANSTQYSVTEKPQLWPPGYDFIVLVDSYQQFHDTKRLTPATFLWEDTLYPLNQLADISQEIEHRYGELKGKCHA